MEYQVLEYLFANFGQPISRTRILKQVWGDAYFGEEKIVDVNIRRLRMKIEEDPGNPRHLVTVWGKGYKWQS
jgi:DNA-binding response OmpR family regulator